MKWVPAMIYATFQVSENEWSPVAWFMDMDDAIEVLDLFRKGKPWLASNDFTTLQNMMLAMGHNELGEPTISFQ